jgi:hypothetical protein
MYWLALFLSFPTLSETGSFLPERGFFSYLIFIESLASKWVVGVTLTVSFTAVKNLFDWRRILGIFFSWALGVLPISLRQVDERREEASDTYREWDRAGTWLRCCSGYGWRRCVPCELLGNYGISWTKEMKMKNDSLGVTNKNQFQ